MISHKHKCIFIHIPKAAGTSIEFALGHRDRLASDGTIIEKAGITGRGAQDHRSLRRIQRPILQVATFSSQENLTETAKGFLHLLRSNFNPNNKNTVNTQQFKDYFKFTIVRNPWSRAYSAYKNIIDDPHHRKALSITSDISLSEYIKQYQYTGFLMPQTYWIKNFKGEIGVDFVCRFEQLHEDFEIVKERVYGTIPDLPHKMKGIGGDYRRHYNNDLIELVAETYQEEIKAFDYKFE